MGINARDRSAHPPQEHAEYRSTLLRAQQLPLVPLKGAHTELTGPVFGSDSVSELDSDLTRNAARKGEPVGERIVVTGRVLDEGGRALGGVLVEVWQANAAGRYAHSADRHDAPLDPNFLGAGRTLTEADGRYRFTTVRPGAYPWRNHRNAWRPAHIHFSVFGRAFAQRLVTQMYFPGDPLLPLDPIFNSVPGREARQRLVSQFSPELTVPAWALAFEFDIVLRGPLATPTEG